MKLFRSWAVLFLLAGAAFGQGTAITYQGRLSDNGAPANGTYELRFALYPQANAGSQVGPTLTAAAVPVSGGLFVVELDFGAGVFSGQGRWLEVAVRTNGAVIAPTVLIPRQAITPAPYAIQAVVASNLLGNVSDAQLSANILRKNAAANLTGTVTFNPAFGPPFVVSNANRVTQLNADLLDDLDSTAFAASNHTHDAAAIVSGSLPDARLSTNVVRLNSNQVFVASNRFAGVLVATNGSNLLAGTFSGNANGLTNLNATNLAGVLPATAVPTNVARLASNQTFTGAVAFNPAAGAPFQVGGTTLVTNLNADLVDGQSAAAFWNVAGNSNAAGAAFVGTVDNSPLELRANNSRVLRFTPNAGGVNIVAGHPANSAATNFAAGTVSGGFNNAVSNNYATVAGGTGNLASGSAASVSGGNGNAATNSGAVVPGGTGNVAGGVNSLAAGAGAQALHANSFVWADGSSGLAFTSTAPNQVLFRAAGNVGIGTNNPQSPLHVAGTIQSSGLKLTTGTEAAGAVLVSDAAGNAGWQTAPVRALTNATSPNLLGGHLSNSVAAGVVGATIGGGGGTGAQTNFVGANYGTVAGGRANNVSGISAFVGGGEQNRATGVVAVVTGGSNNLAGAQGAFVGGGVSNNASGINASVVGGATNSVMAQHAVVAGGLRNGITASASNASIGGGTVNTVGGAQGVVAGGESNLVSNSYGTVGGGRQNTNSGAFGSIGGGEGNRVSGDYAAVPGGSGNLASGTYSLAAGRSAQAQHAGAFVWADNSSASPFSSTANNQFLIRAAGGVGVGGAATNALLDVKGSVRINDADLYFRGGTDSNHGLGWYGPGKTFAGMAYDGPVLYGYDGGLLATRRSGVEKVALSWDENGFVAVGTNLSNPFTVEGVGTSTGGVGGFPEVVARFERTGAGQHTGLSIDAVSGQDAVLYLAENGAAVWDLRNDSSLGDTFQIRYQGGGGSPFFNLAANGSVGIGVTNLPGTDDLVVNNGIRLDEAGGNSGGTASALRFGNEGTGEAISSQRTAGTGQFGLDFYTVGSSRVHVANGGNVGIGTRQPGAKLDVQGSVRVGANGTVINKMQAGSFSVGGGSGVSAYTFPWPASFSGTPKVILTPRSQAGTSYNDTFTVTVRSISATQVTINVYRVDEPGAAWAQALQVDWMAWE